MTILFRPSYSDLRVIGLYTGRVLLGVGVLMLVPAAAALLWREPATAPAFLVGAGLACATGLAAEVWLRTRKGPGFNHALVIAALSWLAAPLFGAVPLFLSGHYTGFLDAYFDAMSGFATAGLSVINDLDHLSASMNLWRHLMQFIGGQGLVLVVLSVFTAGSTTAFTMYAAEAREEKILPNVVNTARFIARVSLLWLTYGVPAIWISLVIAGLNPIVAIGHAINLFMAAFSTGGFAPQAASVAFYRSGLLEAVLAVVMVAGATSFGLHYYLLQRRVRPVLGHLELKTSLVALIGLFAIAVVGLVRVAAYPDTTALLRRSGFYLVSALTTTGFGTLPSRTLVTDWGVLAPAMVVVAMGIGAMSGSTGGGIKAIRIGLLVKALRLEIRRVLSPPSAVVIETYQLTTQQVLRPALVQSAALIVGLYLTLYAFGALVGMFYGYPFDQSFFESVSATATVGLSIGITGPTMPLGLKLVYIFQMWAGRLEMIAVLALFGFAYSSVRGRV